VAVASAIAARNPRLREAILADAGRFGSIGRARRRHLCRAAIAC
jgi:hypothetical protein